jgi:16S rRNA C967 or C1407 C5-methylase (RsmB/RsmF family)
LNFDKILVDAPCSGTGTIRKSLKTLKIWHPNMVQRLAAEQRSLLNNAYNLLRPGGTIVYSTCSLEPEENEGVIDSILSRYDNLKIQEINLKGINRSKPILEFEHKKYSSEINKALRIWPQDNDTEGFFVCKLKHQS